MVKQRKNAEIKTDSAQFVAQAPRGLSPRRGASAPRGWCVADTWHLLGLKPAPRGLKATGRGACTQKGNLGF